MKLQKNQILISAFVLLFINFANGQSFKIDWQIATRDSIDKIIKDFGSSLDLYFENDVDEKFITDKRRPNSDGKQIFRNLFVWDSNSSYLKKATLPNFIDPEFIRLLNHYKVICNDTDCRNKTLEQIISFLDKKISAEDYIENLESLYADPLLPAEIFEGTYGKVDSVLRISQSRNKIAAHTWEVLVYVRIDFQGDVKIDETSSPVEISDLDLCIQIEFEEVKSKGEINYANFRIGAVHHLFKSSRITSKKHILNLIPYHQSGLLSVNLDTENNVLDESLKYETSMVNEAGLLLEHEFSNFFRNKSTKLTLAGGVSLLNHTIHTLISDGYMEQRNMPFESAPFQPSSFLKQFLLESDFGEISNTDYIWFAGVPLKLGIKFELSKKLSGYFNMSGSYLWPISQKTSNKGSIVQTGIFTYEHSPGIQTIIRMGSQDNLYPQHFGTVNSSAGQSVLLEKGLSGKTEFGIGIPLKNSFSLKVGPFISYYSFGVDDPQKSFLAEPGGIIKTPLNALTNYTGLGYGISLSLMYEITKTITER